MSNLEDRPDELVCEAARGGVEVLAPRDVPLGGPRAMSVRRTLPQRGRSLIGAWCFLDHYGPDDVAETGGMSVAPHPHTGLQTVSWLFTGEVEHRDSAGHHAMVRPGELNLMTAGRGISHSEVSPPAVEVLHGAQLWVALPADARDTAPGFDHYAPPAVDGAGWTARVFLGSLLGSTSPVRTATPLVGAELVLTAGTELDVDVDPAFEHGLLVDTGAVALGETGVARHELAYLPPGSQRLSVAAREDSRVLLLGGPPFGEAIVMWWNFVGRTHEEVVGYREEWMAQIRDGDGVAPDPDAAGGLVASTGSGDRVVPDAQLVRDGRFGVVVGDHLAPIPAPALPNARLRERR